MKKNIAQCRKWKKSRFRLKMLERLFLFSAYFACILEEKLLHLCKNFIGAGEHGAKK
ncbi:hypothetical protein B4110_2806 [Parageobacillus toebii]|jgi:hypothetical protein|uniref:Uncharacterized protein n=1 Tax=Parageobacillus toebii TaxID=153151 RepID=A0A150N2N8_9BACL|nr:hypothetical protein B4110_2806 [Parageobacillus toebii]